MSISYDLRDIKGFESLTTNDKNILNVVILMTPVIGMGEITEKNAVEFFTRFDFLDKLRGPMMTVAGSDSDEPYRITLEDVRKFIGLKTNVFPKTPPGSFAARILKHMLQENTYRDRQRKQEEAERAA